LDRHWLLQVELVIGVMVAEFVTNFAILQEAFM
jgi:hypothetical protein